MNKEGHMVLNKLASIVLSALLVCFSFPCFAYAQDSSEARAEFADKELSRLFVEVDNYDECEFVMYNYDVQETVYLQVRDEYRERYDSLVGDDSVSLLSVEGEPEENIREGMPLELVSWSGAGTWSPWRDVLCLYVWFSDDNGIGSAFLVSGKVAITAAHCVMADGEFASYILAESSPATNMYEHSVIHPSKAIVQKEWVVEDAQETYDHDFAILLFDDAVQGSSGEGEFSYDGITAASSLALTINCAGYIDSYEDTTGCCLWKNENDGVVASWENLPVSGNDYKITLSVVQGMSGGPVYCVSGEGQYTAVGILSHFSQSTGWSYACRITERLQVLIAWAEEGGYGNTADSSSSGGSTSSPNTGGSAYEMLLGALRSVDDED